MKENTIGIIGKSNTGKTRKILFPEVTEEIKKGNSLVILDSKLEYYNNFAEELKGNDYIVKVVNFADTLKNDGYNPLEYAYFLYNNDNVDMAIEVIKNIGLTLFSDDRESDPFWATSAADYFIGIVLILFKISKEDNKKCINLSDVAVAIKEGDEKYKDSTVLKTYIDSLDVLDPIYIALSSTIYAPPETKGSILAVLKQKLNSYFMRPNLLNAFNNAAFHVPFISNKEAEKIALFIVDYKPITKLSNILLLDLINVCKTYEKNMTFILDGLDELEPLLYIESTINYANTGKLKLYATTRNMDELNSLYGSKYTFNNMEKCITLNEKIVLNRNDNTYPLPNINKNKYELFSLKDYMEKNKK